MVRHEEARLRSLFRRLLVLSAALTPACSSAQAPGGEPTDASLTDRTAPVSEAGEDAGVSTGDAAVTDATLAADGGSEDAASSPDARDIYGYVDAACDPQYLSDAATVTADGGDAACQFFEYLPCGLPPDTPTEVCALLVSQCGLLCSHIPTENRNCAVAECLAVDASSVPASGPVTLECATAAFGCGPGVGRRPCGLAPASRVSAHDPVGALLAEMAHLEAASVHAFRRLAADLARVGAPRALVRQAQRAARDEVRHARATTRLARRRGATPAVVEIEPRREPPSLLDLAIENGVEGCIRETFGALAATHQAAHASDPAIAVTMTRIARDETRHAALAWALARWLAPRIGADGRAAVKNAMRAAVASLREEVARTPADVARPLGLPTGRDARALVDGFAAERLRAA
jgi:hypothetical protein